MNCDLSYCGVAFGVGVIIGFVIYDIYFTVKWGVIDET